MAQGQGGGSYGFGRGGGSQTWQRSRSPDVVDLSGEDYHRRPDPDSPWRGEEEGSGPNNRTLH